MIQEVMVFPFICFAVIVAPVQLIGFILRYQVFKKMSSGIRKQLKLYIRLVGAYFLLFILCLPVTHDPIGHNILGPILMLAAICLAFYYWYIILVKRRMVNIKE